MTFRNTMALACVCATSIAFAAENNSRGPGNTSGTSDSSSTQSQKNTFFDAKTLMDTTVENTQGDNLGKIHNILFNPQNSEFFATIDAGSGRYAVVPWKALTITSKSSSSGNGGLFGGSSSDNLRVTMNTTKEALRSAPTVSEKQEARLNNPDFLQSVYRHYKMQPPSAMGGSEGPASGSSSGGGSSSESTGSSGDLRITR